VKKTISLPSAPKSVPRLKSLLHRLQQTPGPDDDPYLDQLMMFLDDPPDGVTNRWMEGAKMCASWGITCSHTSVYRLFLTYAPQWRAKFGLNPESMSERELEDLEKRAAHLITLRVGEMLADPASTPTTLVNLARIELARRKHVQGQGGDTERALKVLTNRSWGNWEAQFALTKLRKALENTSTTPGPFPPGYMDACSQFPTLLPPK
jgi:hypothetical protein